MTDLLPALIPHSQRVHAAPLWGSPTLCRPEGPQPLWYSPVQWQPAHPEACRRCVALAQAAHDLDHIEQAVAGW